MTLLEDIESASSFRRLSEKYHGTANAWNLIKTEIRKLQNPEIREVLKEAKNQIIWFHENFRVTAAGNVVLQQIEQLLNNRASS